MEVRALFRFIKSYKIVQLHNEKFLNNLVEFDLSINYLSDLSPEEINHLTNGTIFPSDEMVRYI